MCIGNNITILRYSTLVLSELSCSQLSNDYDLG